jgi:hypothetical protein
METTQEISLCSYLCLKLAKTPGFSYLLCFFFYKVREQEGGAGSAGVEELAPVAGKGVGG